jgi:hypothetical protein
MPIRLPNAELRTREYLTEAEVERLTKAATGNRYGHSDAAWSPTATADAQIHGIQARGFIVSSRSPLHGAFLMKRILPVFDRDFL